MSVFKRKRKIRDQAAEDPSNPMGLTDSIKSVEDDNYTIDFTDRNGVRRRIPAFKNKADSHEMERNVKRLVNTKQSGALPDRALSCFLETAPERVCSRLAEWEIIEGYWALRKESLPEYVKDWRTAMELKGNCSRHVTAFVANFNKVAKACK